MGRGRKNRCARERGRETMTDKFSTTPVEFRGIWIAVTASKNHRSLVAHFCSAFRSTPLPNSSRGTIKISGSGSAFAKACPLYITSGGSQKPRSIPREKSKNRASEGEGLGKQGGRERSWRRDCIGSRGAKPIRFTSGGIS